MEGESERGMGLRQDDRGVDRWRVCVCARGEMVLHEEIIGEPLP